MSGRSTTTSRQASFLSHIHLTPLGLLFEPQCRSCRRWASALCHLEQKGRHWDLEITRLRGDACFHAPCCVRLLVERERARAVRACTVCTAWKGSPGATRESTTDANTRTCNRSTPRAVRFSRPLEGQRLVEASGCGRGPRLARSAASARRPCRPLACAQKKLFKQELARHVAYTGVHIRSRVLYRQHGDDADDGNGDGDGDHDTRVLGSNTRVAAALLPIRALLPHLFQPLALEGGQDLRPIMV